MTCRDWSDRNVLIADRAKFNLLGSVDAVQVARELCSLRFKFKLIRMNNSRRGFHSRVLQNAVRGGYGCYDEGNAV